MIKFKEVIEKLKENGSIEKEKLDKLDVRYNPTKTSILKIKTQEYKLRVTSNKDIYFYCKLEKNITEFQNLMKEIL